MNKSGVVNEFDNRCKANIHGRDIAEHFRRQQQKCRPDALAAGTQKIFTDFGNGSDIRTCISSQLFFDEHELGRDELVDLLRCHTTSEFYDVFSANTLSKLADVCAASSSGAIPRSVAMNRAVSATKLGSFRFPRCGTGAR